MPRLRLLRAGAGEDEQAPLLTAGDLPHAVVEPAAVAAGMGAGAHSLLRNVGGQPPRNPVSKFFQSGLGNVAIKTVPSGPNAMRRLGVGLGLTGATTLGLIAGSRYGLRKLDEHIQGPGETARPLSDLEEHLEEIGFGAGPESRTTRVMRATTEPHPLAEDISLGVTAGGAAGTLSRTMPSLRAFIEHNLADIIKRNQGKPYLDAPPETVMEGMKAVKRGPVWKRALPGAALGALAGLGYNMARNHFANKTAEEAPMDPKDQKTAFFIGIGAGVVNAVGSDARLSFLSKVATEDATEVPVAALHDLGLLFYKAAALRDAEEGLLAAEGGEKEAWAKVAQQVDEDSMLDEDPLHPALNEAQEAPEQEVPEQEAPQQEVPEQAPPQERLAPAPSYSPMTDPVLIGTESILLPVSGALAYSQPTWRRRALAGMALGTPIALSRYARALQAENAQKTAAPKEQPACFREYGLPVCLDPDLQKVAVHEGALLLQIVGRAYAGETLDPDEMSKEASAQDDLQQLRQKIAAAEEAGTISSEEAEDLRDQLKQAEEDVASFQDKQANPFTFGARAAMRRMRGLAGRSLEGAQRVYSGALGNVKSLGSRAADLVRDNPAVQTTAILGGGAMAYDKMKDLGHLLSDKLIDPIREERRFRKMLALEGQPLGVDEDAAQLFYVPTEDRDPEDWRRSTARQAFALMHQHAPELTQHPRLARHFLTEHLAGSDPTQLATQAMKYNRGRLDQDLSAERIRDYRASDRGDQILKTLGTASRLSGDLDPGQSLADKAQEAEAIEVARQRARQRFS